MSLIIMILLISVLILVHELGHFLVARAVGLKPEKFGFGLPFGPTLYEKKWGDTVVCVHALLLGGYVSFADDDPDSPLPEDDENRIMNRPVWQRFLIVSAGVFANAVLAYVLVLIVALGSGGLPVGKYNVYVDDLYPKSTTVATEAGFAAKDKIIKLDKAEINNPAVFLALLNENATYNSKVYEEKVEAVSSAIRKLNPSLGEEISAGTEVILPERTPESPMIEPVLKKINPGEDYENKKIVELNDLQKSLRDKTKNSLKFKAEQDITLEDLATAISDTEHPLTIVVLRNGKEVSFENVIPNEKGVIGIKLSFEEISQKTTGLLSAVKNSWTYLWINTTMMIDGLVKLFTGKIPMGELHGIIAIAKVGGDVIQYQGIWKGFLLTAIISMNLAILNLLPIPALDGGHILFLAIEKIFGKRFSTDMQETFVRYGFSFLILLMVFVICNDIFALVTKKF
ncbi:MAG TPA: RIP metalloprotease RseP [Candidatus Adamsella sp.]|nr:RIP metalloprotease RseP [Candidatus Adamsella sp.]